MEVRYRNTLGDVLRFNLYTIPRLRGTLVLNGFILLALLWAFLPLVRGLDASLVFKALLLASVLLVVFAAITAVSLLFGILSFIPKLNKGVLTDHRVVLSESGVLEETPLNRTECGWKGIEKVVQTPRYILLYISQFGAHVIPKRAFPSPPSAQEFFEYAHEHLSRTRSG